jgi:hypothetical protein
MPLVLLLIQIVHKNETDINIPRIVYVFTFVKPRSEQTLQSEQSIHPQRTLSSMVIKIAEKMGDKSVFEMCT